MSYGFTSGFAKDLEDMIALKATFGFSEATYLDRAKDFDRHCSGHPDADRVTEPIVISWLKAGMSKADGTVHRKAAFARAFGRYQRSTGRMLMSSRRCSRREKVYLSHISSAMMS